MRELLDFFTQVLSGKLFPLQIGLLIVTAMFVGAIIDGEWREYRKWAFAGILFLLMDIWIRVYVIANVHHIGFFSYYANIAVTVMTFIIYMIGVAIGIFIVNKATRPYKARRKMLENQLEELSTSFSNDKSIKK